MEAAADAAESAAATVAALTGGKRGAPKDPNAPKKPKTAFQFFGDATRVELHASMPEIHIDMLSQLISDEWKKLAAEERAPYEEQARADKERPRAR